MSVHILIVFLADSPPRLHTRFCYRPWPRPFFDLTDNPLTKLLLVLKPFFFHARIYTKYIIRHIGCLAMTWRFVIHTPLHLRGVPPTCRHTTRFLSCWKWRYNYYFVLVYDSQQFKEQFIQTFWFYERNFTFTFYFITFLLVYRK